MDDNINTQNNEETEEPLKKRSPIVRALAIIGAAALVALSYALFRYGYLWRL